MLPMLHLPLCTGLPTPAFVAPAEAKIWLAEHATGNPEQQALALAEQLERLQALSMDGGHRAGILEAVRPQLMTLLNALAADITCPALPMNGAQQNTLQAVDKLALAAAIGYGQCAEQMVLAQAAAGWIAVALHRAAAMLRQLIRIRLRSRQATAGEHWALLWRVFLLAQQYMLHTGTITDPLATDLPQSSIQQLLNCTVLLALLDRGSLDAAQLDVLDGLVGRWRDLPTLLPKVPEGDEKRRYAPLHQWVGASAAGAALDVTTVRGKLKQRLDALRAGESAASLHLGKLVPKAAVALMERTLRNLRIGTSLHEALPRSLQEAPMQIGHSLEESFAVIAGFEFRANKLAHDESALRILRERMGAFAAQSLIDPKANQEKPPAGHAWSRIRVREAAEESPEQWTLVCMDSAIPQPWVPGRWCAIRPRGDGDVQLVRVDRVWAASPGVVEMQVSLAGQAPLGAEASLEGSSGTTMLVLPALVAKAEQIIVLPSGNGMRADTRLQLNLDNLRLLVLTDLLERVEDCEAFRFRQLA